MADPGDFAMCNLYRIETLPFAAAQHRHNSGGSRSFCAAGEFAMCNLHMCRNPAFDTWKTRAKHVSKRCFLRCWCSHYVQLVPYQNPGFRYGQSTGGIRFKTMFFALLASAKLSPGGALLCAPGTVSKPRISCSQNTAQIQPKSEACFQPRVRSAHMEPRERK